MMERRDPQPQGGQPTEQRPGGRGEGECIEFMSLTKVCTGDVVLVQTPRLQVAGCVRGVRSGYFGEALLLERTDGKVGVVKLKYVAYLEVLERGGCR